MIQGCQLTGEIAYTVYTTTEQEMQKEIIDGVNNGYIMQVGKIEK